MPTVTRVLPWRRHQLPVAEKVEPLVEQFRVAHPKAPADAIVRAYEVAEAAHDGQMRKSGEPYITHPLAVATIVAHFGLDETTVVAALLHDAVEDTALTLDDLTEQFGAEVAALVDGVTKLDRIHFDSKEAQQAAAIRKMLVAMADDIRVLVIKLADRLHNMRTIAALPAEKQEQTAWETMDVYAPLAHRLGMGELKQQLEDLCFAALHPKIYSEIDHMVATRSPEREIYLAQVEEEVRSRLAEVQIEAEVTGRPKHMWSIYEKMVVRGKEFDDIHDLVGMRVIVGSEKDCYAALGSIHSIWTPVPGRFKDYIATPKFNLYQSLHTTVVGPQGKPVEVQIRTREMHQRAESGIAAHFSYKAGEGGGGEDLSWLNRMVDWQHEMSDPAEFMANLKSDLEQDEVYVFTPKGDVHNLPVGSTPVDFAYAIHTEVGHRCIGARVDGRLVPLETHLKSGDTVEIFTSKVDGAGPSLDWLEFVATRSAQTKIKQWFSRERREDALEAGREMLAKALRSAPSPVQKLATDQLLEEIAQEFHTASVDALHTAIGEHRIEPTDVVAKITGTMRGADGRSEVISTGSTRTRRNGSQLIGVNVEGLDDVLVRIARCCTPVPGDPILGFLTRGRGVSIHRADCEIGASLARGHGERLIDVSWDDHSTGTFSVVVEVKALDRSRLLQDVTQTLSDQQVNIVSCLTSTGTDRVSKMRFEFELGDPSHLEAILSGLRQIDSVYDASRVLPGKDH
ncbi:MAG: bifunctional (p)ppGpp synthetase/guanosine-3',5'-bis(diphosphate) 3'-pyrophosphohydrolase [Acidimicrobiales bacterium]